MADFLTSRPNFYSKTVVNAVNAVNTAGLQSVQSTGTATVGDAFNLFGKRSRATPGLVYATEVSSPSMQLLDQLTAGGSGGMVIDRGDVLTEFQSAEVYGTTDPVINRLRNSNMPAGGQYNSGIDQESGPLATFSAPPAINERTESRVILKDQTTKFIGALSYLSPLQEAGGLLFPYTPVITVSHRANYETEGLIHSNYSTPYYTNSTVDSINVSGRFTAQTEEEGIYILAAMQFLRAMTKMFYGASSDRGTPPPVLFLDAYGNHMFDHVPVVVRDFSYSLPNDVNYITVKIGNYTNKVPVDITLTVDLVPTYSRNKISNDFSLNKFADGALLGKGFI